MSSLYVRTLSQGLQAFVPIAAALLWCSRNGSQRLRVFITTGLLAALALSFVAAAWFRASTRQALAEASLAGAALVIALFSAAALWRGSESRTTVRSRWLGPAVAGAAALIVVRQTMEMAYVFQAAAFEVRSFDATSSVVLGAAAAVICAWVSTALGRRLTLRDRLIALKVCLGFFLVQALIYAFHESAEAGLLPSSEALHAATEPYGPDGRYGVHFSDLLIVGPLVSVGFTRLSGAWRLRSAGWQQSRLANRRAVMATICGSFFLLGMQQSDARAPRAIPRARPEEIAAVLAGPHLLVRNTRAGGGFGALGVLPLDGADAERRLTDVTCQRVSFAQAHGLCLHLERGIFNVYSAIQLDKSLKPGKSIKLVGLPSRTRISPDGRLGAVTVFVIGDDYAADFSTRTTLIDLEAGEEIGELEQFSTWRNGERFRGLDFNFWGVTFAADGNTFYATLRTAGRTYLVRGELALRRLTVLRENVECPSLSPDNRLLAYKKRIGPSPDSWRLHVLELMSNVERIVDGETRYIDDQVEWLDSRHLLYSVPRRTTSTSDVWIASLDPREPARVFVSDAESPIVVR
jgi:hypothetical protein